MSQPTLKIIDDVSEIPAADWDGLTDGDPTLSHAFFLALQESGCAMPRFGWQAHFITLWQGAVLVGAMPLYLKTNSFGEHVFDFSWADAYHQHGLHYYPKLVCAVPFTPVSGQRLLAKTQEVRTLLFQHALQFARETGVSSLHCLFLNDADVQIAQSLGMMLRQDVQFHWKNQGYSHFDDYLDTLSRDKRKRIKQERRRVQEAGIEIACISGRDATPEHWAFFAACYLHTLQLHNSPHQLNEDFFQRIGVALPDHTLLVIASREGRPIASALNYMTDQALYGRSWGTFEFHSGLHFEVCYYQAIEYCIAHKLQTFEGGAGGEHKLARGFMPVTTRSAHWLAHPQFAQAVENYLAREHEAIAGYVEELNERSPYKRGQGDGT
ncbi:MAG: GNAT family N-acetyltransferase [Sideroxydans sp.]|nr:GNAT family N-acetyltransferase [Sideroxydans sp.]